MPNMTLWNWLTTVGTGLVVYGTIAEPYIPAPYNAMVAAAIALLSAIGHLYVTSPAKS